MHMKTPLILMLFFATLLSLAPLPALAQGPKTNSSLEGIWKWTFTMPDGSQVTPRLELREEAGHLSGTTRLRPGSEATVTNLTIQGDKVSFEVVREREGRSVATHYAGTWSGDTIQGTITSNSDGSEQSY